MDRGVRVGIGGLHAIAARHKVVKAGCDGGTRRKRKLLEAWNRGQEGGCASSEASKFHGPRLLRRRKWG